MHPNFFGLNLFLRFRVSSEFCVGGLQSGPGRFSMGRSRGRFRKTRERRAPPPLILEQDGVVTRYWREGGHVRCREFETDGASGG